MKFQMASWSEPLITLVRTFNEFLPLPQVVVDDANEPVVVYCQDGRVIRAGPNTVGTIYREYGWEFEVVWTGHRENPYLVR